MSSVSLPDEVRVACAWVADRARSVRIEETKIEEYAAGLAEAVEVEPSVGQPGAEPDPETRAAFAICMNAINFGSGWWPTIHKRPGLSGYGTMAAGVEDRFSSAGPWSAEELGAMDAAAIAAVLGQDPGHPLMAQFAAALRDVGAHLAAHDGRYLGVTEAAGSVPELARALAGWASFADTSSYDDRGVPFFKRVDGVLGLEPALVERIEAEELLAAASGFAPAEIDSVLWSRGRDRRYKSIPRPRSRNTAY